MLMRSLNCIYALITWTFVLILLKWCVFVSSRRRHTRCALVTGVQTCALPISRWDWDEVERNPFWTPDATAAAQWEDYLDGVRKAGSSAGAVIEVVASGRSEERRVGKACVSTCRSRWSPSV